jgi:hypothetical protein
MTQVGTYLSLLWILSRQQGNDFGLTDGVWARCVFVFMCAINEHQSEGGKLTKIDKGNPQGKLSWKL